MFEQVDIPQVYSTRFRLWVTRPRPAYSPDSPAAIAARLVFMFIPPAADDICRRTGGPPPGESAELRIRSCAMTAFGIHVRVVASLIIREMNTRFGNKAGGYLWALIDPLAYIAMLSLLRQALSSLPPLGDSIALFMASGYLGFVFYQTVASNVSSAVQANRALLSYPRVAPIDTVFARFILQVATTAVVVMCTLFMISAGFGVTLNVNWPVIAEAAGAASVLGLGMGMCNIALFLRWPWYESVFSIVNRPLFLLSGVFMLPDEVPHPAVDYLLWNPLIHVVMWFRMGFYPEYRADMLDKSFVIESAFVMLFVGMALFSLHRSTIKNA
jgi:capsular polysaccharide transport system permease protein